MYELSYLGGPLKGHIELTSSKSLANRALIIQALTPGGFTINRLATADDTVRLQYLLASTDDVLDAGPAGTTFRFLTAFLCRRPGTQVLTGSQRMKERPIGILVDALKALGAQIEYVEKEGYPPLRIGESKLDKTHEITISAGTSSQYISALLMLAPTLPKGLRLTLAGDIVSLPYINMTLSLMRKLGINHSWDEQTIVIEPQVYDAENLDFNVAIKNQNSNAAQRALTIEADWSAASYYYSLAAIAPEADLQIDGLFEHSVQGDSVLQKMYTQFGVQTTFNETGLRLTKAAGTPAPGLFEYDFLECPDVAQTLAVTCAALGTQGLFTGLKTLKIKETDRVAAVKKELKKVKVYLSELPAKFSPRSGRNYIMIDGKAAFTDQPPVFATYHDHRMAMAFAPLALLGKIQIESPMVVVKSYPEFYADFAKLGVTFKEASSE